MKKQVVLGFLGSQLDLGGDAKRWERWRPTVSLAQQADLMVARFEILYSSRFAKLMQQVTQDIHLQSPHSEVRGHLLELADPWDFEEVYAALYDFAKSYPFDTEREEYLIHITTGTHVSQICLFLMAEAHFIPAKLLQTSPSRRKNPHNIGEYTVIDLDLSRYNQLAQRFSEEHKQGAQFLKSGIATRNPHFNRIIDEIEQVAANSKAPMLLMGPTGAGKSFLARRVYELKKARHQISGRFVEINCATLHGDGAGSTLFGHVKGAFTGAMQQRAGLLMSAHKGLLFLDEIGELGLDEQAMLLKAIEEKRFNPVGGDEEVQSDFQLIAGTNRDLALEVTRGRFREDLFARINLWTYELPGLAGRPEDLEPNLDYMLGLHGREMGSLVRFNKEARDMYLRFAVSPLALWSGNFRDLGASVTRMATLAQSGRITEAVAAQEIARLQRQWRHQQAGAARTQEVDLADYLSAEQLAQLDQFDAIQLQGVLAVCRSALSLSDAGRRLFAASRAGKARPNDADRLKKYLARFDLSWQDVHPAA
ncbi:RNA repair transcriptional activator RtcR [Massilia sp. W12]|uniref:RNA repair transcriptional activator RtcR n=1 Tax=Massilia sp. W12 TaxID=3126507 RepID=UPI0030D49908